MEKGVLYVAVDCSNCGRHGEGRPTDDGKTRCGKCGAFATPCEGYCSEHDVDMRNSPTGNCPHCRMERDRQNQMMHEMTRDPMVEPW